MSLQPTKSVKKAASGVALSLLVALARAVVGKYRPRVIGVTGSVGKTTTKEAIYYVLRGNFDVERSRKNANTEWGITASVIDPGFITDETSSGKGRVTGIQLVALVMKGVWRLIAQTEYPEILVLELAADKPGDIRFFNGFLEYDIVVITRIGQVHLEFYKSQEQLTQEKLALVGNLKSGGLVVIDGDGKLTQDFVQHSDVRKVTFGWHEDNGYSAKLIGASAAGIKFSLAAEGYREVVEFPFGRQVVLAALVAAAVARELGLDFATIVQRLSDFTPPPGRFEIDRLQRGITLINDAYNANPDSMKLALLSLQDLAKGRRVAILGGMAELGVVYEPAHQEIGRFASDKADLLIFIGRDGRLMADAMTGSAKVIRLDTPDQDAILDLLHDNDTVLVKASRAIGLDKLAKALKQRLN